MGLCENRVPENLVIHHFPIQIAILVYHGIPENTPFSDTSMSMTRITKKIDLAGHKVDGQRMLDLEGHPL